MPVPHTNDSESLLLRTPAASEAERGHHPEEKARARGGQVTLSGQFMNLPTPLANEHTKNASPGALRRVTQQLTTVVHKSDFGKFQPVINRWEKVTGNKAPEPTKLDGKNGNARLSSEFTEWMMGLEPGWITGVGLSRKDELKACGNGVVPQQAMLALKMLKARLEVE
jgi:DNA (cytosine-5)-methyltransferase 1